MRLPETTYIAPQKLLDYTRYGLVCEPLNLSFWKNLPSCSEEIQALKRVASTREVPSRMTFL